MRTAALRADRVGHRATLVVGLAVLALLLGGPVASAAASISIESAPGTYTRDSTPSFAGGTSDPLDEVTLDVYEGSSAGGTVAESQGTLPVGEGWSLTLNSSLSDGTYTAVASQPELAGLGGTSESPPVTFTVDTVGPTVSLDAIASPSNDNTPTLSGAAGTAPGDHANVEVEILQGANVIVATEVAQSGGRWSYTPPALPDGSYTARASQSDDAGNPPGTSGPISFTIDTSSPTVTLQQPPSPSSDTTPSFSGTATDTTNVEIDIHEGTSASGPVVATAGATGTGGGWTSGQASPALPSGRYTAVAMQESSLGNPPGTSAPVSFTIDTSSPVVTLSQPPTPSNDATPTFSGTASDTGAVVVHIFNASHSEVESTSTSPSGGLWSTSGEGALASGTYSATATQQSSLGNPAGTSNTVTFRIETNPPRVTLDAPAGRSNVTTPSFTGTASDDTQVIVQIYRGARAEGSVVSSASAAGTNAGWSSGAASPGLSSGQYTAVASQASSLGNGTGRSAPVTFEVDTSSPSVTLNRPVTPSNNTTPSFSGTASDTTTVTVRIYKGAKAEGSPVSSATASGANWNSTAANPALASGQYTAVASQASSLGNGAGSSAPVTFTINTSSPSVTLKAPQSPSNNTTPSFTGSATDTTTVTIRIYAGTKAEGSPVSSATAAGTAGAWSSSAASPALASGQYTAVASQPSSLGNPDGTSAPVGFVLDTSSPTVTLAQPPTPSNHRTPTFTGSASGKLPVTIRIYAGTDTRGAELSSATATGTGGAWTSGAASPALAVGTHTYTAVASQASALGNPPGASAPVTFTVDTTPPQVTLSQPAPLSNDTRPSFTGTGSDTSQITVKIYAGARAEGSVVATASAGGTGGAWSSTEAIPALGGKRQRYTAVAVQPSSIGNAPGMSNAVTFVVDTAAPTLTLDAPRAHSNSATPSFSGTSDESTAVTVDVYAGSSVGGTPVASATAAVSGGSWRTAVSPALADGRYTVAAKQRSHAGNSEAETAPASVTIDTVAPQITLLEPADGSAGQGDSQVVRGTAGLAGGDLTAVTVQLFSGSSVGPGQAPVQSIVVNAAGGPFSTTFAGLAPGAYTVRALQSDEAGNLGVSSASSFTLGIAGAAPTPSGPSASFSWFPPNPSVGETVSLVSSASDDASPLVGFAWDTAGIGAFASAGASIDTTFATPGKHLVQLRVTDAAGRSSVASNTIAVSPLALPLMQPFPIVRITSLKNPRGVRLRLLSVLAPAGAQISISCTGLACPVRSQSHLAGVRHSRATFVEFRRFERALRAGVVIQIRVTKAGVTGKYTRLAVRRGKRPVRLDACLAGLVTQPSGCPSA